MKEATLSNCLTIKLEGPSILAFNPEKAIDVSFQKAIRRPGTPGSQDNRSEASEAAAHSVVLLDDEEKDEQSVEKEIVHENPPEPVADQEPGPVYQLVQEPDNSRLQI